MKLKEILSETQAPAPFPDELPDVEPRDSEQDGMDLGTRTVNKDGGRKHRNRGDNYKKAQRIKAFSKRRSKDANRGEASIPAGWRADPHAGGYNNWRTQT